MENRQDSIEPKQMTGLRFQVLRATSVMPVNMQKRRREAQSLIEMQKQNPKDATAQ